MPVGVTMLLVDYADKLAPAEDRHGQKRLVTIFRQLVKRSKARIRGGIPRKRYRLLVFRYPARDSLAHAQPQPVDFVRVGILGGLQAQFVDFEQIDQARIAVNDCGDEFDHARQYRVERIGGSNSTTDLLPKINSNAFFVTII